jgi:hypothetical protein
LIVNREKGIFTAMATRAPVRPQEQVRHDRRPAMADLRAQVRRVLREQDGIDFTGLSRDERDRLLAERFGI